MLAFHSGGTDANTHPAQGLMRVGVGVCLRLVLLRLDCLSLYHGSGPSDGVINSSGAADLGCRSLSANEVFAQKLLL